MRRACLLAVAIAATGAGIGAAHHSFASFYNEGETIRLTGELVEFDYRAPHAWVKIKVHDSDGREQIYAAEWSNPNRLAHDGVTRDTFTIGDRVIVAGSPGRVAAEHRLHLKAIQRIADGWEWPQDRHRRRKPEK